jgi:hypothetical protein
MPCSRRCLSRFSCSGWPLAQAIAGQKPSCAPSCAKKCSVSSVHRGTKKNCKAISGRELQVAMDRTRNLSSNIETKGAAWNPKQLETEERVREWLAGQPAAQRRKITLRSGGRAVYTRRSPYREGQITNPYTYPRKSHHSMMQLSLHFWLRLRRLCVRVAPHRSNARLWPLAYRTSYSSTSPCSISRRLICI